MTIHIHIDFQQKQPEPGVPSPYPLCDSDNYDNEGRDTSKKFTNDQIL
jgi:hypothetical protein